jgi:hypothetical protein
MVTFTLRPLYPRGKNARYPLDRRLGGPQNRSGRRGEENILGDSSSDPTVSQPAASRYNDYAIPAPVFRVLMSIFLGLSTVPIHEDETRDSRVEILSEWVLKMGDGEDWGKPELRPAIKTALTADR